MLRNATLGLSLLLLSLWASPQLQAQLPDYTFSEGVNTYADITGATVLGTGAALNGSYYTSVPIGFTFLFASTNYTTVNVSSNGYVQFGAQVYNVTNPISDAGAADGVISGLGGTLQGNPGASISYVTTGVSPNRVFTVQYRDMSIAPSASNGESYTFQIRMTETSNKIDIVYGSCNASTRANFQVGLRGSSNALFYNRRGSYDIVPNWASSRRGFVNTESVTMETVFTPVAGTTFSYPRRTTNDAAVLVSTGAPLMPYNSGTQMVRVTLENRGTNNIDSALISWSVNGVTQVPVKFYAQPGIAPLASATFNLGNYFFPANSWNTMSIVCLTVNGVTDNVAGNNVRTFYSAPRLSGTYDVGTTGGNTAYVNLRDAVRHINVAGIEGPVRFRIRTGVYNDHLVIEAISGATAANTITFESQTGVAADVNYSRGVWANTPFLFTSSSSWITFRNIAFSVNSGSVNGSIALLNGGNTVNISGCRFTIPSLMGSTASNVISANGTVNLMISGNRFINGNTPIALSGCDVSTITNNTLTNAYLRGIYGVSSGNNTITGNTVSMDAANPVALLGIGVTGATGYNRINRNWVVSVGGGDGINMTLAFGGSGELYNNMVSINGTGLSNGINVNTASTSGTVNVYQNSVQSTNTNAGSSAFMLTTDRTSYPNSGANVINNIFQNIGSGANGGLAIIMTNGQTTNNTNLNPAILGDFNNLFTTGQNLGRFGVTTYAKPITNWRAGSGRDQNSASINAPYISNADLHLLSINTALWGSSTINNVVPTDFDGDLRVKPYMGADEIRPTIQIVQQPISQYACVGKDIALTCIANTTVGANVTYQWRKDGVDLIGRTTALLFMSNVGYGASGVYSCFITASDGTTTTSLSSNDATLIVVRSTQVVSQPLSQPVAIGGTVDLTLSAEAIGSPTDFVPTYQWKKRYYNASAPGTYLDSNLTDNSRITGTQSSLLTIRNIRALDTADTYVCIVRGYCGTAESRPARLFIPTISAQNNTPGVCGGGELVFECAANPSSFSGGTISYQWYKGGAMLFDGGRVSGAASKVLRIANASAADAGDYYCVATYNPIEASIMSNTFTVALNVAPSVTTSPRGDTVCEGKPFTLTAGGSGTALQYQWMKGGVNIPNATSASYTVASAKSSDASSYAVMISNSCGSVTSNAAVVMVDAAAKITNEPTDVVVTAGAPLNFTVVATGAAPLNYQWYRDGVSIPNATGATYTINSAMESDTGNYGCIVTNNCGSDTSKTVVARKPVSVSDIVTGGFVLSIATPNPSNDAVSFTYALPTSENVRVSLTDALGRPVATLVNEPADAGTHRVEFNVTALNLTPGVYMYTINAGSFYATQQVVVIK
ncbi:hypothetical protein BH10BAC6_BH10BAC6_14550 [soil metagenome]